MTSPGEEENSQAQGCWQVQNSLLIFLFPAFFYSFFLSLFNEGLILPSAPWWAALSSALVLVEIKGSQAKDLSLRPSKLFRVPVPEMKDGSLSMMCLGRKGFGTRES